jgi:hypothetical protein
MHHRAARTLAVSLVVLYYLIIAVYETLDVMWIK